MRWGWSGAGRVVQVMWTPWTVGLAWGDILVDWHLRQHPGQWEDQPAGWERLAVIVYGRALQLITAAVDAPMMHPRDLDDIPLGPLVLQAGSDRGMAGRGERGVFTAMVEAPVLGPQDAAAPGPRARTDQPYNEPVDICVGHVTLERL